MTDKKQYYITTAISYPNGTPHIGQAYELIATDAIARFKRLDGFDVFFLTGTDEHGQKMIKTAAEAGMTARELADKNVLVFRKMAEVLNASNDDFIRTTEQRHHKTCQALWDKMVERGDIYLDRYAGWYSVRDEAYYDESETEVRDDKARYGPQDTPVEWVEEESYFFKLSAYEDKLLDLYKTQPDFIGPTSRRNEITKFVEGGLRDLSVSRTTFDWGIPVPGNPDHVMYVWVDALTNYVTATGWPDGGERSHYWPADVHIIGKDIVRFHTVYWPAFLMSAGLPLPKRVFGHGFVMNRGIKMSKSIGNVVDPFSMAEAYGVDQMRFFFLREIPFGNDGNYSHEAIVNRINADLANDFGNLAQRSLSMINKNCEGKIPVPGEFSDADKALLKQALAVLPAAREFIDKQLIHKYLDQLWQVVGEANRYFASQEPWALKKTDPERMNTVLYVTAEIIRIIAILAQPVMPESSGKMLDLLVVDQDARNFDQLDDAHMLKSGSELPKPEGVFPRYVETESEA